MSNAIDPQQCATIWGVRADSRGGVEAGGKSRRRLVVMKSYPGRRTGTRTVVSTTSVCRDETLDSSYTVSAANEFARTLKPGEMRTGPRRPPHAS